MKYIIIIILVLSFQIYLYGNQDPNPNCEPKTISTNPKNAINTEKPQKTNTNGVILDWTKPFNTEFPNLECFDVNCAWYNPNNVKIKTPYHQTNNSAINNFIDKIDLPEDGWELITRNIGYYDNGSEIPNNPDNPHFIIYNKYTGLLRVFVAIANQIDAYKYSDIRIYFNAGSNNFYTSLLDLSLSSADKPMRALDDFVNVIKANVVMKNLTPFVNNGMYWFYADFPMTYDPCTCEKLTKIHIEVKLIKKAQINFTGTLNGTITDVDEKNSVKQNTKIDDGKSSITAFLDGGKKIFDTYKSWDSFKGEINSNISASNVTPGTPSIDKPKAVVGLNLLENAIKTSGFAKEVLNQLPLIGAALQFIDFFTSGGQSSVEPTKVRIMPQSITTNINLTGNIETDENYQDIIFYNPGSDFFSDNPSLNQYPYYNQVLGVMNLLNTPKVDFSKSNIATTNILGCQEVWSANEDSVCTGSITLNQKLSFKLPSNLNYVVNPAVFKTNSDDIEIYGSYTIQLDSYYSEIDPYNLLGTITTTNASFPNIATDLIIRKGINKEYYTEFLPVQCLKDNVFSFSSIIDYSFYTMHNSIPTYVSDILNQPFPTLKIWLNLVATLKRKDSDIYPNAQGIIYKTKYLMNTNEISDASMGTANLFLNYPDNLTLHDQSINSDIFAWGDITIGDNVTVATGGPYKVTSGGKIIISNSNSAKLLTPNLILQTGVGNLCNTPMYEPVSDVSSFCNDNGNSDYKPNNRAQTLILKDEETDNSNTAKTGLEIKTELYDCKPNPANSSTSILYYAPKGSEINFDISNIFGEVVIRLENTIESFTGEHLKVIDTSKFPSGTYFVTMRSAEKIETKKLIIIK